LPTNYPSDSSNRSGSTAVCAAVCEGDGRPAAQPAAQQAAQPGRSLLRQPSCYMQCYKLFLKYNLNYMYKLHQTTKSAFWTPNFGQSLLGCINADSGIQIPFFFAFFEMNYNICGFLHRFFPFGIPNFCTAPNSPKIIIANYFRLNKLRRVGVKKKKQTSKDLLSTFCMSYD